MNKKLRLIGIVLIVTLSLSSVAYAANHTMRWDFEIFNNANARQVALNIASKQRELAREEDEKTALERFQESLERQVINRAIREIVEGVFEPDEMEEGWYKVGDDIIEFRRDGDDMIVTYIDADGNETEIIITRDVYGSF